MRDGVIMLFYDISTEKSSYRYEYRNLVKSLKREGYKPLQESVFFKYIRNVSMSKYDLNRVNKIHITQGNVFCLVLSYQVFRKMVALHGVLPDLDSIKSPYVYL